MTSLRRHESFAYFELLEIFFLGLDHAEHQAVPLPHALGVRRLDVLLNDLLPPTPTQPAAKEALNFLNLSQLDGILDRLAQPSQVGAVTQRGAFRTLLVWNGCCGSTEASAPDRRCRERGARRLLTQHEDLKVIFAFANQLERRNE
jgi:hypothetical protein